MKKHICDWSIRKDYLCHYGDLNIQVRERVEVIKLREVKDEQKQRKKKISGKIFEIGAKKGKELRKFSRENRDFSPHGKKWRMLQKIKSRKCNWLWKMCKPTTRI